MAALQYVDVPGYSAILIRNTYADLTKPEALMSRSHEWLQGSDARWVAETKTWHFPSGATMGFGYLDGPLDHFQYQSAAYQFVGIDEVVQVRKNQALYMFSRLRRLKEYSHIPIRFRCASNPPAREQAARGAWVKRRYVDVETRGNRVFIPALMYDNPYLDVEEYTQSLNELDPVTREQIKEGDWNIRVRGRMFNREWFPVVSGFDTDASRVRYWDLAATEQSKKNKDPDWTVGALLAMNKNGILCIEDIQRFRRRPMETEDYIMQTAAIDTRNVDVVMEQEPGASGKSTIDHYRRNVLLGYPFRADKKTENTLQRANPLSSYAEAGNVVMLNGAWINDCLDELEIYPDGEHDDQVVAIAGGYKYLSGMGRPQPRLAWV